MRTNNHSHQRVIARAYWFALTGISSVWGGLVSFGVSLGMFSTSTRLAPVDGGMTLAIAVMGWMLLLSDTFRARLALIRPLFWRVVAAVTAVIGIGLLVHSISVAELLIYRDVVIVQLALGLWLLPYLKSGYQQRYDTVWLWLFLTLILLLALAWLPVANRPLRAGDSLHNVLPGALLVLGFSLLTLVELARQFAQAFVSAVRAQQTPEPDRVDGFFNLPLPVMLLQSDGKVIKSNPAAEHWTTGDISRLTGRFINHWLSDTDWFGFRHNLLRQNAQLNNVPFSWSCGWLLDGNKHPVNLVAAPLRDKWLVLLIDQAERMNVEARLDQALRARDNLTYIINHHLQPPMQALAAQLDKMIVQEEDTRGREPLLQLQNTARLWQRLLQETQAYALLDSREPQRRHCDLNQITHQVGSDYHERLQQLRANFEEDVTHAVLGDAGLLYELAKQLVSNAIKFHSPRRRLKLKIYTQNMGSGKVAWCFADNGLGMKSQQISRMLKPFTRGDDPDRDSIAGSGMGLALAEKIIDIHQGKLMIEAAAEQGCVIKVLLPQSTDRNNDDI